MSDERDLEQVENREWMESLNYVLEHEGPERATCPSFQIGCSSFGISS